MNNIAFITSTIRPNDNVFLLKRINTEDRLHDYESALSFYCMMLKRGIFDAIVYVDNSGYSLDSLKNIAINLGVIDKLEFISYISEENPQSSRFFLEIHLIAYGMKNSILINTVHNPVVWKITGRYLIFNIDKIVTSLKRPVDLYVNFRNFPYKVLDFYLVSFTAKNFINILGKDLSQYAGTTDGELILREQIDNGAFQNYDIATRFCIIPRLLGVRGFDNKQYNSLSNNFKYYLRRVSNFFFPKFLI